MPPIKNAIIDQSGNYPYSLLEEETNQFAHRLLNGASDLQEARIAYMVSPGLNYVIVQWAIWRAGGIAVPLCLTHPLPSLQYVLEDTLANTIVVSKKFAPVLAEYAAEKGLRLIIIEEAKESILPNAALPELDPQRRAMILYTSGTTNKPKGVVSTHANLEAQVSTLIRAWEWSESDHTLCVLPLHHVHGIVNVINCSLRSGATCEFLDEFSAETIFNLFKKGDINVFMAVPTIYFKLIAYWDAQDEAEQQLITSCLKNFRLMVSGSAALPVSVMEKWKIISGHTLLERYGMTEIGMAISNPYLGERKPGHVGIPLPGVSIQLADENYSEVPKGEPGEILIKGANVFNEYWNNKEATEQTFTQDGWFKSGDVAVVEDGYYRIMGRNSVDIIKSGGYKISALEIEEEIRKYAGIEDCAVVGIDSEEWGELIVAALVANNEQLNTDHLNNWLRERIAAYKTPRKYILLKELPRNAMGKVTKNDVKKLFI